MDSWEMDVLLLHMLKMPAIQSRALKQMKRENIIDELSYPVHHTAWEIVRDVDKLKPQSSIPLMFIRGELTIRLRERDDYMDYEAEAARIMDFCEQTAEDQMSEEHGMRYLKALVVEHTRRKYLEEAELLYDEEAIEKFINGARNVYVPVEETSTMYEPLMNISQFLDEAPLVPTLMDPLDRIAGGGMPLGTVNGLLGPTGGGKTMTTYQIAVGQAKDNNHILINTYEQGIKGDIAHRLCSGILEVDIEELRKPIDQWEKEHREKFLKINPKLAPFIHINDMTLPGRGCRGIMDIEESYKRLYDAKQAPIYIIVDWLKPLIMRYLATTGMTVDDHNWRSQAYVFLDNCLQFAKETQTIFIINHQLDTKTSRASSRKKPVVTDAMELRSFAFNLDACYLIGNRDKETNIAWLLADKNRRGAPLDMLVRMNGKLARFEEANGYVADHKGRFIKEDQINAMPEVADSEKGNSVADGYV